MSRTTPLEIFAPASSPFLDTTNSMTEKTSVELSKTVEVKIPKETFSYLFNPYSDADEFNAMLLLNKMREFFNIKHNAKLFSTDLESKISYNYPTAKVNPRKLTKLVHADAPLFTAMFESPTNMVHPDPTLERNSKVYEEIAYDIKNMIEETTSEDVTAFWESIIPGDNVMIVLRMNMSAFSTLSPTLNIFVKFIVDNPAYSYDYALDLDTSSTSV
jgi:hypothetical protein